MIFFGGIDPGTTGAMALLDADGNPYQVFDYPGEPGLLWSTFNDKSIHCFCEIKLVVLEQATIMPMEKQNAVGKKIRQNPKSLAVFQQNYGIWQMAITAMGWPLELAHPTRWRKVLDSSVPRYPSKDDLLNFTRRRWPGVDLHRKNDHNKAEALLISSYARLKFIGQIQ